MIGQPTPIREQTWPKETKPEVSIFCLTYNHETFIRDAIEGFLFQETTFPVKIFIHDDASSDGTPKIVREYVQKYPQLVHALFQEKNQWSTKRDWGWFTEPLFAQTGKFVALCEGDDYWTDPRKLQKQVEYLRTHPGVRLLCTRYLTRHGDSVEPPQLNFNDVVTAENWASPYSLSTVTAMFRRQELAQSCPRRGVKNGKDIFLWRLLLQHGEAHVLSDCTAVYRLHKGGVWSGKTEFKKTLANLKTAQAMLRHFGKSRQDIWEFYKGCFKDCLRQLSEAELGELFYLMGAAARNRICYFPRVLLDWGFRRVRRKTNHRPEAH